jgi:hypothetical protein
MVRRRTEAPKLPPPTTGQVWQEFLKWSVGVPLVCVGGLGLIGGTLWLAGGQELMWQTTSDMGTALFWIAAIALMYPFLLVLWVADLRQGLKRARDWAAMTPEAQGAAKIATPEVPEPKRGRKKG